MKYLLLALLVLGCGPEIKHEYVTVAGNVDIKFEGYYYLDGGDGAVNCIYLDRVAENIVHLDSDCQSLVSVNPENKSLGQFPRITNYSNVIIDNKIRFTKNVTYSSGNDLEEDVSGSNITGSRRTDVVIEHEAGKLKLTIKVYKAANNSNLNSVVAVRVFREV